MKLPQNPGVDLIGWRILPESREGEGAPLFYFFYAPFHAQAGVGTGVTDYGPYGETKGEKRGEVCFVYFHVLICGTEFV